MGRIKIWDAQFQIKWLDAWLSRLKAVAEAAGEDSASIARAAIEREIVRREKRLGISSAAEGRPAAQKSGRK